MKFIKNKPTEGGGPSSAIGIMRFFDADSKSPKLNPYFVIGAVIVLAIVVIILQTVM